MTGQLARKKENVETHFVETCKKLVTIREFQLLMKEIYFVRDSRRGVSDTLLWLISESGEWVDAYLRNDRKAITDEAADVLAWLSSVCNLAEIDLETASLGRYDGVCPRCRRKPCACVLR